MSHPSPPASPLGPVKAIGTPSLLPQASFSGWKKLEKSNSEGKKSSKQGRFNSALSQNAHRHTPVRKRSGAKVHRLSLTFLGQPLTSMAESVCVFHRCSLGFPVTVRGWPLSEYIRQRTLRHLHTPPEYGLPDVWPSTDRD